MARRRRRRLTRNQKFAGSAVVAGLLLAAGPRAHTGPGRHRERPGRRRPGAAGRTRPLANCMAAAAPYGWTGSETTCLDELWTRESGFETDAANPQTGARHPAVAARASTMAAAGPDWPGNPATQIRWGLGYIAATYGTPCAAWSHEEAQRY